MTARGQRGQAAVELALVLPLVALVLLAVVQVGLIVRDEVLVLHAAREGARAAAVALDHREDAARRAALGAGGLAPERTTVGVRADASTVTVTVTTRIVLILPIPFADKEKTVLKDYVEMARED